MMFTQRHTAYKVSIKELITNPYISSDGESPFVEINGLRVSRVNVIATIVQKFVNNGNGFVVLDDGTESIRARTWDNPDLLSRVNEGDLVLVIGRVRAYNEETYLIPEIIKQLGPNWYLLRKVELIKREKLKPEESVKEEILETVSKDSEDLITKTIKDLDKGDGAGLNDVIKKTKMSREDVISVLKKLLENGLLFEPTAQKYKLLD